MSMERREAWRESLPLRAAFDRLFEDAVVRVDRALGSGTRDLAIDLCETEQGFTLTAALPGVRPEDINLTVEHQTVTIEGEWQHAEEREDQRWHLRERAQGRFVRTVRLPAPVDGERVEAHTEHGLLVIKLPKAPAAQRRRIAIGGQRAGDDAQRVAVGGSAGAAAVGGAGTSGRSRPDAEERATPREVATGANAGPGGQAAAAGQSAASTELVAGKQPQSEDPVTQQSIDSFPASDPPSYTPGAV